MSTLSPLSFIVPLEGKKLPSALPERAFSERTDSNSACIRRAVELLSYAMMSSMSLSGMSRLAGLLLPFLTASISCDVFRLIVELMLWCSLDEDGTRVCNSVASRWGDATKRARSSSGPEEFEEGTRVALDEGSQGESESSDSLAALTVKSTGGMGQT